jgi:hypothetical protein
MDRMALMICLRYPCRRRRSRTDTGDTGTNESNMKEVTTRKSIQASLSIFRRSVVHVMVTFQFGTQDKP